jgi:2'-5' RNA ligase
MLNKYLLLLQPDAAINEKIMEIKKTFATQYKLPEAAKAKPHITLLKFSQVEAWEQKIIHRLGNIANSQAPIKIELQNFGSFPTHTIYINVTTKTPIQDLVKNIRTNVQKLLKLDKDHKPHFILESHITIARKLLPWQYEQGWLAYSHAHFTGRFIVKNMLLLKKNEKDIYWKICANFLFANEKTKPLQTTLF